MKREASAGQSNPLPRPAAGLVFNLQHKTGAFMDFVVGAGQLNNHTVEPGLFEPKSLLPGNGISGQRQRALNGLEGSRTLLQRQNLAKPARQLGLLAENREISVRTRMLDGPGRTRTSNQAL